MKEKFARIATKVLIDDDLLPVDRLVYAALDKEMDKGTRRCAPTMGRLAALIGCSRGTIVRSIDRLEERGHVRRHRRNGWQNEYELLTLFGDADLLQNGTPPCYKMEQGGVAPALHPPVAPALQVGGISPYNGFKEQEKEQGASLSFAQKCEERRAEASLFAEQIRKPFHDEVRYRLGEDVGSPEAAMRDWFPPLVAEFFLSQCWHRESDGEQAVLWARRFARINATESEVASALDWAVGTPTHDGKKVIGRPAHLERIIGYIQSKRRQRHAQEPERGSQPTAVDFRAMIRAHGWGGAPHPA